MKSVMQIVRNTSLFFQPQIRTKILNEGWASYWHRKLYLKDARIKGNEVAFARVDAKITALPRLGLNPYALGMRLFSHIEDLANKGKLSYEFQRIQNAKQRADYDMKTGDGQDFVFNVREDFSDFMFINLFIDQDFVDKNRLFVSGKKLNSQKGVWEYYVESRDAAKYKNMLLDSLYHPPYIQIDEAKTKGGDLYLNHHFEGKPIVKEFIPNTMLGIEYLWGGPVKLETTEWVENTGDHSWPWNYYAPFPMEIDKPSAEEPQYRRVLYTMEKRKLSRTIL